MFLVLKQLISHFLMEVFLISIPTVYIFRSLFVLREYVPMLVTSLTETDFRLCRYHMIRKAFSKFYHIHSELIIKCIYINTIFVKKKLFCNRSYLSQYLMVIKLINSEKKWFEGLVLLINSK